MAFRLATLLLGIVALAVGSDADMGSGAVLRGTAAEAVKPVALAEQSEVASPSQEEIAESRKEVALELQQMLDQFIHSNTTQPACFAVALNFGIILTVSGEASMKIVLMAAGFVVAMVLALADLHVMLGVSESKPIFWFVGAEAGVLGAIAVAKGYEGVKLLAGAAVGAFVGYAARLDLVKQHGWVSLEHNEHNMVHIIAFYSFFVVVFTGLFYMSKHRKALAVVCACIGGLLLSASLSWLITTSMTSGGVGSGGLRPVQGDFVDFMSLLVGATETDYGIFAGTPMANYHGYRLDRILGCIFWFIFFGISTKVQIRAINKADRSRKVSAREVDGLQESLLADNEE